MPVYEIELSDGRVFQVESDAPPSEADVLGALGTSPAPSATPPEEPSGAGSVAALGAAAARNAPAAIQGAGRFVANHPAGVQKVIGAGMTALGGTIGAGVGSGMGPTGAIVGALTGASVRGLTPTQAAIREWSGRVAGESKGVAQQAGRAVGIQEYIKNTSGLKVKPTDILERAKGLPAGEAYAKSQGRDILKILGPSGEVVAGPTAEAPRAAKGAIRTAAGRAATGAGRILSPLMTGVKVATSPAASAVLAGADVNRRLNAPETLDEINDLRLPMSERTAQNPVRDRILSRLAEMLGM